MNIKELQRLSSELVKVENQLTRLYHQQAKIPEMIKHLEERKRSIQNQMGSEVSTKNKTILKGMTLTDAIIQVLTDAGYMMSVSNLVYYLTDDGYSFTAKNAYINTFTVCSRLQKRGVLEQGFSNGNRAFRIMKK